MKRYDNLGMDRFAMIGKSLVTICVALWSLAAMAQNGYGTGGGFNPANPQGPGANGYYPETHTLVIDALRNSLDDVLYEVSENVYDAYGITSDEFFDSVEKVILCGEIDDEQYNYVITLGYAFPNLRCMDLSRTYGKATRTFIPDIYESRYSTVILPETVEQIYSLRIQTLKEVYCYAEIPPIFNLEAYGKAPFINPEDVTVYVPMSSIELYKAADYWKDTNIMPIEGDVTTIVVIMPKGADGKAYTNMNLMLTDEQTGSTTRYVLGGGKDAYYFPGLRDAASTTWSVTLSNRLGSIVGRVDGIKADTGRKEVALTNLAALQTAQVCVTAYGKDVTRDVQCTWRDMFGNRLTTASSLAGMIDGDEVKVELQLPTSLIVQYAAPAVQTVKVGALGAKCEVALQPASNYAFTTTVRDARTQHPIQGATISAVQKYTDNYSYTFTAQTDADGRGNLQVREGGLELVVSAPNYSTAHVTLDTEASAIDGLIDYGDIKLSQSVWHTVNMRLSIFDIEDNQPYPTQATNMTFSVYNNSKGVEVTDVRSQGSMLTLADSNIDDGDELTVTITSTKGEFSPVEVPVTISGTTGTLEASLVPKGGFLASFKSTENVSVASVLYDSEGNRVGSYTYPSSQLKVLGIDGGSYTLVTIVADPALTGIGTLEALAESGLRENVDYVANYIDIDDGRLTEVQNGEIPTVDCESFKMINNTTTLSLSEPKIVQGTYVTLRSRIFMKSRFVESYDYSDFNFVVDIPEGCHLIDGSVMLNKEQVDYEYDEDEGRVEVYFGECVAYGNIPDISMCILAEKSGIYNIPAYISYAYGNDYDSKSLNPVGSVTLESEDVMFNVMPYSYGNLQATGRCAQGSTINVYADDALVSKQVVTGTNWIVDVPLTPSSDLTVHPVWIECITPSGCKYVSPTQSILINKDANRVKTVTMLYDNEFSRSEETCDFNFIQATLRQQKYDFYPSSTSFTYVIDFVRNDTTEIRNVQLYVKQIGGTYVPATTFFDTQRNSWVALYETDIVNYMTQMPVNVAVAYDLDFKESKFDRQGAMGDVAEYSNFLKTCAELARLMFSCDDTNVNQKIADYEKTVGYKVNMDTDADMSEWRRWYLSLSEEEKAEERQNIFADVQPLIDHYDSLANNLQMAFDMSDSSFTAEDGTRIVVTDCSQYDESQMEALGFTRLTSDDGTCVYVLNGDDRSVYVDFNENSAVEVIYAPRSSHGPRMSVLSDCVQGIQTLGGILENVTGVFNELLGNLSKQADQLMLESTKLMSDKACLESILRYDTELTTTERIACKLKLAKVKASLVDNDIALKVAGKMPGLLRKLLPIANYAMMIADLISQFQNLENVYNSIPFPCQDDFDAAMALRNQCETTSTLLLAYSTVKFAGQIASDIAAASSAVAAAPTGGMSLVASVGIYIAKTAATMAADFAFNKVQEASIAQIRAGIAVLECEKDPEPEAPKPEVGEINRPRPRLVEPLDGDARPLIDPSGFVCEAVGSNRLEGATVTCYYKSEVEDEYGDKSEEVVVWDAENYGQQNPLLTDAQGMYSWMVPVGNWQVVYEKDGYETQRSAWLPVPPPQLDVNVGLVRLAQPTLADAQAYEGGIDLGFDLYMKTNTVNDLTVTVEQDGKPVEGSLQTADEEPSFDDSELQLASRFRFVPDSKLTVGSEVKVKVSRLARSYADIPVGEDTERTLTVGREITFVGAEDSVCVVPYLRSHQIVIKALSAQAAAHRTVTVRSLSDNIATIDAQSVVLDAEGKAYITVDGKLPGVTYLTFTVDGTQVSGMASIHVVNDKMQVPDAPRASIISGTYVPAGTQVALTAGEGCTIYYTLDGSCPCDETRRQLYTGPITISKDTKIRTLAVSASGIESESVTYTWFVDSADGIGNIQKEGTDAAASVYDLMGRTTDKPADQLGHGIYIIKDDDGTRKVIR